MTTQYTKPVSVVLRQWIQETEISAALWTLEALAGL